jgi:hypothetical protein
MIKVALFGMDDRAQNVITMFLTKNTQIPTAIVPRGEQAVAIVDLDGVDSQRVWMDLRRQFSGPAIVLSVREQTLRNAFYLAKPFNAQTFLTVLERVQHELAQLAATPSAAPTRPTQAKPTQATAPKIPPQQTSVTATSPERSPIANTPTKTEANNASTSSIPAHLVHADQPSHAAQLISEDTDDDGSYQIPDEVYTDPARRDQVFFNVNQSLLGLCNLAKKQAQTSNSVVFIDGLFKSCYVYPDSKHIFTEMRWRYLKSVSMMDLTKTSIKLSLLPTDSIAPVTSQDPRIAELEGILWSIAAWSARGRVPIGTPLDHPVHLLHWPNLTRLSEIPGAMQISALWIKQPTSLMDTAVFLGLPYRHVFSFYVACQTLGLVHIEVAAQPTQMPVQGNAQAPKPAPIATEKRGLFSRMLSKLGIK